MSPSKRKKGHDGPRDPRNRRAVYSAGTSPLKSNIPPPPSIQRVNNIIKSSRRSSSSTHAATAVARGSGFSLEIHDLCDDSGGEEDLRVDEAGFSIDPQRVLVAYRRGKELGDSELDDVLMKSAIAKMLKRNSSGGGLSFSIDELMGMMADLVGSRDDILALAERGDMRALEATYFAKRLREAIPDTLNKRNSLKNILAENLAEVYTARLDITKLHVTIPSSRSKSGKALSNFIATLGRVHVLCAKELQEEGEKVRYMKSVKLTGECRAIVCVYPLLYLVSISVYRT